MKKYFLTAIALLLMAGCQSFSKKIGATGDIFARANLSNAAQECLKNCEVNIVGPEAVDRSKDCACKCHKTHNTGRFQKFCSSSGYTKSEHIDTIHDSMVKGESVVS